MSPAIGVEVSLSRDPLRVVRTCCEVVERVGHRVRPVDIHGVEFRPVSGLWAVCLPTRVITIAGAVLLGLQPPGDDGPFENIAARALGVTAAWFDGVMDGFAATPANHSSGPRANEYAQGVRAGGGLWALLTNECEACGERAFAGDRCGCGRRRA